MAATVCANALLHLLDDSDSSEDSDEEKTKPGKGSFHHAKRTSIPGIDVFGNMSTREAMLKQNTGMTLNCFCKLVSLVESSVLKPRQGTIVHQTKLNVYNRVLMAVLWLHNYSKYNELALLFGVSASYVSLELHHILPIFSVVLRSEIRWPSEDERKTLRGSMANVGEGALFIIDTTKQLVNRSNNPVIERKEYSGIIDDHCRIAQAICLYDGSFVDFEAGYIAIHHDSYTYRHSKVGSNPQSYLSEGEYLIADSAYHGFNEILTSYSREECEEDPQRRLFNHALSNARVRIENQFGILKLRFSCTKERWRHVNRAMQAISMLCAAELTNFIKRIDHE